MVVTGARLRERSGGTSVSRSPLDHVGDIVSVDQHLASFVVDIRYMPVALSRRGLLSVVIERPSLVLMMYSELHASNPQAHIDAVIFVFILSSVGPR